MVCLKDFDRCFPYQFLTGVKKPRLMELPTVQSNEVLKIIMCNDLSCVQNNKTIKQMEDLPLSLYSNNDNFWNKQREATEILGEYLQHYKEFKRWGIRAVNCANFLNFRFEIDKETGEIKLKLVSADFCKLRHCPVCNWRRSLRLKASFFSFIEPFMEENPRSRWIFLTLTTPNVPIEELGEQLTKMNQAWKRFTQRKAMRFIKGFVRTTEVTREKKRRNYAHPHFHVVLQVDPSYFQGKFYLSHDKWLKLWQESMRDESIEQVNVQAVKAGTSTDGIILEITKAFTYSIKLDDYKNPDEWLLEYFRQVHRRRFIVAGGNLKNAIRDLREEDEDNESLINVDDEDVSKIDLKEDEELYFNWRNLEYIYRKYTPTEKGI